MSNSETEKFCLSWSQFVPSMVATLRNLHDNEDSKDVTLISDDGVEVKCHRFILDSNSGFFNKLFSKGSHHKDPIVYLTHISSSDLKNILKFMYLGQVFLEQESLNSFMFAASKLMVQGLSDYQHVTQAQIEKPQEDIVMYDYQKPQLSPTAKPSASSQSADRGVSYDPIDVIQQQTKTHYDPIQDFIDGLPLKKESLSPSPSDGAYSVSVGDVVIPHLASSGPSQSGDSISVQVLDWNRGVDNEYVVTSADSSVKTESFEQKYYQCEKCDYKSTKMFNVKKHTAAVHDGVRYPCQYCDYKATETGHLRKHVRARHGNQLLDKTASK